ncbi:alpha/beta hydrolase-fold protein [Robiginitalea sp. M366]|uniref:alpha/beta hydrolase n=1 Tax=Robiginitalea aestuariiviva TaxID=3036903 RepID=UPI00240D4FB1|nr:alpha/beta hydrolase-fold protein [Robiginitalea aestuariiviva]MDG1571946.1 alpha/beta hydrolase-fold protein [Robiginitalea aestuariiviva]
MTTPPRRLRLALSFILLFTGITLHAQDQVKMPLERGFCLHSSLLGEDRTGTISLPDSYGEAGDSQRYPVLILLDGAAHFQLTQQAVTALGALQNNDPKIADPIIVAIDNVDRERDFTVTKIQTLRPNTMGGGRKFLGFIETELLPYLDATYRTRPYRILVGHSLGGLLAVNAYLDPDSVFDAYMALDPSIWWEPDQMADKVAALQPASCRKRIYLATANQGPQRHARNKLRHDALVALIRKICGEACPIQLEYFPDENHRSVPRAAISKGLHFLFLAVDSGRIP